MATDINSGRRRRGLGQNGRSLTVGLTYGAPGLTLKPMVLEEEQIRELLKTARTVAVVGLSPDPEKPSNSVARYMREKGYRIIPVNPAQDEIIGEKSYKSLSDIPEQVDIVDIFMRAEKALPVVEEALRLKPKAIWLQLGIRNDDARRLVEQTDVGYVEDRCVKQEHARLLST